MGIWLKSLGPFPLERRPSFCVTWAALWLGFHFACLLPVSTAKCSALSSRPSLSCLCFPYLAYLFCASPVRRQAWWKQEPCRCAPQVFLQCLEQCLAPSSSITIGMNEWMMNAWTNGWTLFPSLVFLSPRCSLFYIILPMPMATTS